MGSTERETGINVTMKARVEGIREIDEVKEVKICNFKAPHENMMPNYKC